MSHSTVEYYHDGKGEWRWRVRDDNGNITGDSAQGYTNKADARTGWLNVKDSVDPAALDAAPGG